MIENKEFNSVAQLSHFGWGMCVIFASVCLFPSINYFYTGIIWTIYSAIKEFWYDYKYETTDVRGSSIEDFLFQVGGSITAIILLWIKNIL